jgi:rhodanese-related sulfurtransferase
MPQMIKKKSGRQGYSMAIGRVIGLMVVSLLLSLLINAIHPHGIPLVQDWSYYVESKARAAGIAVIPLGVAFSRYQSGDGLFVDARKPEEYAAGHIPHAVSIPFNHLEEAFEALEVVFLSDRQIIVYCKNRECDDALGLAIELEAMGISNVLYYVDGFDRWEASGCPVEQ